MRVPVRVLLVLTVLLALAAAVLAVLDVRADARSEDRSAAVAAARSHLVDLGAASADPDARRRVVDGAAGPWRDRLVAAADTGSTSTLVRSIGLEDLAGDTARVLAVGLVGADGGPRPFRAAVALTREDDRWLVVDVEEVP